MMIAYGCEIFWDLLLWAAIETQTYSVVLQVLNCPNYIEIQICPSFLVHLSTYCCMGSYLPVSILTFSLHLNNIPGIVTLSHDTQIWWKTQNLNIFKMYFEYYYNLISHHDTLFFVLSSTDWHGLLGKNTPIVVFRYTKFVTFAIMSLMSLSEGMVVLLWGWGVFFSAF